MTEKNDYSYTPKELSHARSIFEKRELSKIPTADDLFQDSGVEKEVTQTSIVKKLLGGDPQTSKQGQLLRRKKQTTSQELMLKYKLQEERLNQQLGRLISNTLEVSKRRFQCSLAINVRPPDVCEVALVVSTNDIYLPHLLRKSRRDLLKNIPNYLNIELVDGNFVLVVQEEESKVDKTELLLQENLTTIRTIVGKSLFDIPFSIESTSVIDENAIEINLLICNESNDDLDDAKDKVPAIKKKIKEQIGLICRRIKVY